MAEQGFTLTSPDFQFGAAIPQPFTCDGGNSIPALKWMHPPEGTQSFALLVEDPDAPSGTFTHWIHFNIPAKASELAGESLGVSGRNDFQQTGYGGPCPPPNHGDHRYFFRLYALDVESLDLTEGATRDELVNSIKDHVLEEAELMGKYRRQTG